MSEIRENRLTGEWVIVARERAKRGGNLVSATRSESWSRRFWRVVCSVRAIEAMTADERFRFDGEDGRWVLRSVVNKFSVLSSTGKVAGTGCAAPGETSVNCVGLHEVLIESPQHNVTIALCPVAHVHRILEAYCHRFVEFYADPRVRHVIVFKNHGADAGASQQHPHSQIVGIPIVPGQVVERIERARRFFADSGQCLACSLIAQERDQRCRIIAENAEFVAFIPYAALSPYHLWIFPKTHEACVRVRSNPRGIPFRGENLHLAITCPGSSSCVSPASPASWLSAGDRRWSKCSPLRHDFQSTAISHNTVVVFQFRVVAPTESFFSKALLESLVLPYPFGQWR